jgi:hypothetical protein
VLFVAREGGTRVLVKRPSLGRHETLIRELTVCQFTLENGGHDPLAIGSYALAAVIEFVNGDLGNDGCRHNELAVGHCEPLHDCRPPLLFDRPKSAGRPTDQAFDGLKAAAMGVEVLLAAKMKRGEAGKSMADVTRWLGIRRPDGKQITARTMLTWRDEIETAKREVGAEVSSA